MRARVLPLFLSLAIFVSSAPDSFARGGNEAQLNFKIYSPEGPAPQMDEPSASAQDKDADKGPAPDAAAASSLKEETPQEDVPLSKASPSPEASQPIEEALGQVGAKENEAQTPAIEETTPQSKKTESKATGNKVLQGYIRVVPSGTKIPIIMDTAIDSDTSQEGDEFSARTGEDLSIDGQTAVPAGSIIKGRIARLNTPRALNRSGSVALKFDTVTTPDNKQIPIVANLVARGGVVHARRGLKDIAIDCGSFTLPTAAGLGIGILAGASSSSSISAASGAAIGAGVGAAIGLAVLLSKKGKRVDVRPGDELKIELAEDLRMPMM